MNNLLFKRATKWLQMKLQSPDCPEYLERLPKVIQTDEDWCVLYNAIICDNRTKRASSYKNKMSPPDHRIALVNGIYNSQKPNVGSSKCKKSTSGVSKINLMDGDDKQPPPAKKRSKNSLSADQLMKESSSIVENWIWKTEGHKSLVMILGDMLMDFVKREKQLRSESGGGAMVCVIVFDLSFIIQWLLIDKVNFLHSIIIESKRFYYGSVSWYLEEYFAEKAWLHWSTVSWCSS